MSTAAAPSRKRSNSARQAILTAAFALLEEEGFERLSIEGVAARAGVGKTTIYRWWPTKGVMAVEAFLEAVTPAIAFRRSRSARADIVRQMKALAKLYRGHTGHLVCQMIGASQLDPAMRKAFTEGFLYPRRECAYAVFERGVAGGEFRADDLVLVHFSFPQAVMGGRSEPNATSNPPGFFQMPEMSCGSNGRFFVGESFCACF